MVNSIILFIYLFILTAYNGERCDLKTDTGLFATEPETILTCYTALAP